MKLITLALAIALTGCRQQLPEGTDNTPADPNWELIAQFPERQVFKVVDTEDGVICYVVKGYRSTGISCIAYHSGELEK